MMTPGWLLILSVERESFKHKCKSLKKTKVKWDLLTDIDMFLMVEKGIRGGICHAISWYAKANNKYMKDYDINKESSNLKSWDLNNLHSWATSQ